MKLKFKIKRATYEAEDRKKKNSRIIRNIILIILTLCILVVFTFLTVRTIHSSWLSKRAENNL